MKWLHFVRTVGFSKEKPDSFCSMVPTSPGRSWNLKRALESPGILPKFWKSPGIFLWLNSPKERFLSKHQHFSGLFCMLNLAVHGLTEIYSMQQCLYILSTSHIHYPLGHDIT